MRYDTPVYFQTITAGEYDSSTGDYGDSETEEAQRYACVMDTRTQMLKLVYGDIRQGSLTVMLQNRYTEAFDRIRVGENVYRVDYRRNLRTKQTFVVSEVR